jgi:hypothetical protein
VVLERTVNQIADVRLGVSVRAQHPVAYTKAKKWLVVWVVIQKTVKNAVVVYFDPSSNIAWVTGPVPGTVSGIVRLTTMGTKEIESVTYNSATQVVAEGVGVTLPAQAGLAVTQDAVEEAQAPAQSEPKADKETTQ